MGWEGKEVQRKVSKKLWEMYLRRFWGRKISFTMVIYFLDRNSLNTIIANKSNNVNNDSTNVKNAEALARYDRDIVY